MFNSHLPQGQDALICRDIQCNVAGLFLCTDIIVTIMEIIEEKFSQRLPIHEVYGSLPVKWNSGRLLLPKYRIKRNVILEFETLKKHDISPSITFSNPLIKKEDLNDVAGNEILELLESFGGTVIVSCDRLYFYIKEKYPKIKLKCSMIRTAIDNQKRDEMYYSKLALKYDAFVVNVDDNFNFNLLEKIDKNKAEILVNERCYHNCIVRDKHYLSISEEQIEHSNGGKIDHEFLKICKAIPEKKQLYSKLRNVSLSLEEYKKLYDIGFRNFKIQGRTNCLHTNVFDILRFTLEPNLAFSQAYPIISEYLNEVEQSL